jgi:hypothetical protein
MCLGNSSMHLGFFIAPRGLRAVGAPFVRLWLPSVRGCTELSYRCACAHSTHALPGTASRQLRTGLTLETRPDERCPGQFRTGLFLETTPAPANTTTGQLRAGPKRHYAQATKPKGRIRSHDTKQSVSDTARSSEEVGKKQAYPPMALPGTK